MNNTAAMIRVYGEGASGIMMVGKGITMGASGIVVDVSTRTNSNVTVTNYIRYKFE